MDCYSRRIVGWALADHLRAEPVDDALAMAVARRRPDRGLVHDSDRGSQYTSLIFTRRCRTVGIEVSMGAKGSCFDNAVLESFYATIKRTSSTAAPGRPRPKPASRSSSTSRPSITAGADTPRSATSPRRSSRTDPSATAGRLSHRQMETTSRQNRPKPPNHPVSTEPGEVQILVMFMLLAATSVSVLRAVELGTARLLNARAQLVHGHPTTTSGVT
jgi:Integrase core domain